MSCDCNGFGLEGKVAVVTGGASGIGLGCARFLAEMGASVVLFDVDEAKGTAAVAELGPKARFVKVDVRSEESCRKGVAEAKEAFGRIDALVNCAGVIRRKTIVDLEEAEWDLVLDVGLKLAYYHGLQKGIGAYRYLYVNPTLGKTVALTERVSLSVSGSFGAKLFNDNTTPVAQMNRYDLLVGVAVPIAVVGPLYVKPSVSWAWTDLPDKGFADEMVVFGAVNIGAAL